MKKIVMSLSATLVVAAMVGCGCGSKCVTPLSGEWKIVEVNGKSAVGEKSPTIGFSLQDSMVYGDNSCNRFFGRIVYDEKDASAISFSNVGTTMMICADSPMEQEIQAAVNGVASFAYTESENEAELRGSKDEVLLLIQR